MERENIQITNDVHLSGTVTSEFTYSHEYYGEKFYLGELSVERKSGVVDKIPIMVSDRMVDMDEDYMGRNAEVSGEFHSYNASGEGKRKLMLFVFVKEFVFIDDEPMQDNEVYFDAFVCKEPVFRETPFGRQITDLLLAVNRRYGKSDYIPCIVWGRNAVYASGLYTGAHVEITGRIQSREYVKKTADSDDYITHTAYEVSVSTIREAKGGEPEEEQATDH